MQHFYHCSFSQEMTPLSTKMLKPDTQEPSRFLHLPSSSSPVSVCMCAPSLSRVWLLTPQAVAYQAPLSMEFSMDQLGWVAIPFSTGSSWPSERTHVSCSSCIGKFFTIASPGASLRLVKYTAVTSTRISYESLSLLLHLGLHSLPAFRILPGICLLSSNSSP